ncbi:MAG: hypothetical protein JST69_02365 [Bacteroidetes bacterium]|nr:hypothetical protein [Bacteroidota bacterium]
MEFSHRGMFFFLVALAIEFTNGVNAQNFCGTPIGADPLQNVSQTQARMAASQCYAINVFSISLIKVMVLEDNLKV